jgi:nanoRNase/pAp phosphatase (c-di-AMP/oligoRNAs hydrolase)
VFSLRSSENGGLDVSAVAALFGGGGHKHAAGFRVDMGMWPYAAPGK